MKAWGRRGAALATAIRPAWRWLAVALGLLMLGLAVVVMLYNDRRSFALQVQTHGMTVEFRGALARPWSLDGVILCLRRARQPAAPAAQGSCDSRLYDERPLSSAAVEWPDGVMASLLHLPGGPGLEVEILPRPDGDVATPLRIEGMDVPVHSRLIVPAEAWDSIGELPFSGFVVLGGAIESSVGDHLVGGRFEAREAPAFRHSPVAVTDGEFFTGDVVRLARNDPSAAVATGFIIPTHGDEKGNGFEVIAYSGLGDGALEITRPGVAPSVIRPSWSDRALHDPIVLGATALLAFLLASAEVIKGMMAIWHWCRRQP